MFELNVGSCNSTPYPESLNERPTVPMPSDQSNICLGPAHVPLLLDKLKDLVEVKWGSEEVLRQEPHISSPQHCTLFLHTIRRTTYHISRSMHHQTVLVSCSHPF